MISKQQLIKLWCSFENNPPQKYKALFSVNGFMRLVQGTFLNVEEREKLIREIPSHSLYCSAMLNRTYDDDEWTEETWNAILRKFVFDRLQTGYDSAKDEIIDGIACLLEIMITHVDKSMEPDFSRFYGENDFGYFNMPHIIDVAEAITLDITEYLKKIKGFCKETEVPKFDMNEWKQTFHKSNRITTLKNSVTDGRKLDLNAMPKYDFGSIDHYAVAEKYYPYAEDMAVIHDICGKYVSLRKINDGAGYIEQLLNDYGWIVGFRKTIPIYKINTVQGFAFYVYGSNWFGGTYIDDVSIKKISFGNKRQTNSEIDQEQRIFIVYNKKTGYWQLPKLNYPVKYKQFIQEILKKEKATIGKWNETVVYANSRTLCGDTSAFNLNNYPDIKNKEDFICKIAETAENAANALLLKNEFNQFGLKITISTDKSFDFDKTVKQLNCITQKDVNRWTGISDSIAESYEIERYS